MRIRNYIASGLIASAGFLAGCPPAKQFNDNSYFPTIPPIEEPINPPIEEPQPEPVPEPIPEPEPTCDPDLKVEIYHECINFKCVDMPSDNACIPQ